ncbi:hypothetical protein CN878_22225 [Ochrobactrum sp. 695/2009]|nr:hypothetical protein CN881_07595 [Ochrobactrum sp. 721/2009]PJT15761.1 hypothetical protein CN880_12370 [Ochrobactrum sp. 720/2009]PJT23877.1 hypothetical protein CN879_08560 [Ochrobactrum sp. 715/2009]PJT24021.1 hypothetical protein CN878_22225 [Ochrobactrum sp. 695/2009]PJT33552.1 hypothetical protein CN877_13900 [Ochrobactrum sp. 689/2009]
MPKPIARQIGAANQFAAILHSTIRGRLSFERMAFWRQKATPLFQSPPSVNTQKQARSIAGFISLTIIDMLFSNS